MATQISGRIEQADERHLACVPSHHPEVLSGECDPDKENDLARESGDDPYEPTAGGW